MAKLNNKCQKPLYIYNSIPEVGPLAKHMQRKCTSDVYCTTNLHASDYIDNILSVNYWL